MGNIEQENHIKNILIHNLKTLPYPNTMEFEKMSDMELSTVIDIVAYIVDDYKNMELSTVIDIVAYIVDDYKRI